MKHAHDITLILPEGILLDQFEDVINFALKNCLEEYYTYYWNPEQNMEIKKLVNIHNYSLKHIASGDKLIIEFED